MYGRIVVLTLKESTESNKLKEFANDIVNNPAYEVIVARIKELPGFVFKMHTVIDTVSEQKILSKVIFDNEQNFLEYANAAENISVWEIFKDYAESAGLKVEINDSEVTEHSLIQYYISNL
jgi:hypothetical protein